MDAPDQEIDHLYAERYRNEVNPPQSPIPRDSLENSSDGGHSVRSSLRSSVRKSGNIRTQSQNSSISEKISKFEATAGHQLIQRKFFQRRNSPSSPNRPLASPESVDRGSPRLNPHQLLQRSIQAKAIPAQVMNVDFRDLGEKEYLQHNSSCSGLKEPSKTFCDEHSLTSAPTSRIPKASSIRSLAVGLYSVQEHSNDNSLKRTEVGKDVKSKPLAYSDSEPLKVRVNVEETDEAGRYSSECTQNNGNPQIYRLRNEEFDSAKQNIPYDFRQPFPKNAVPGDFSANFERKMSWTAQNGVDYKDPTRNKNVQDTFNQLPLEPALGLRENSRGNEIPVASMTELEPGRRMAQSSEGSLQVEAPQFGVSRKSSVSENPTSRDKFPRMEDYGFSEGSGFDMKHLMSHQISNLMDRRLSHQDPNISYDSSVLAQLMTGSTEFPKKSPVFGHNEYLDEAHTPLTSVSYINDSPLNKRNPLHHNNSINTDPLQKNNREQMASPESIYRQPSLANSRTASQPSPQEPPDFAKEANRPLSPIIRNSSCPISTPPPAIPSRRPSLLRVVTENQFLETSNYLTDGSVEEHGNLLLNDHESSSPPFFQSSKARSSASQNLPNEKARLNSNPLLGPGPSSEGVYKFADIERKFATPSPRSKAEFINGELSNPAGLLAYVTRDSNSPRIERSITGLIRGKRSPGTDSEDGNSRRDASESPYCKGQDNKHPVKVLPSELNSTDVIEKMRNPPRRNTDEQIAHSNTVEDVMVKEYKLVKNPGSSKKKKKNELVMSINRTISKGKNSLRLRKHQELLEDSSSISSHGDFDADGSLETDHRLPRTPVGKTNIQSAEKVPSDDASSGHSSRISTPRNAYRFLDNEGRRSSAESMSYSSCSESQCSRNALAVRRAHPEPKKEKKQKMTPKKFWSFTTNVIFPKSYPDHPERDSLDGNLPGSSHGTGNPPPPPAPPQPGPASREAAKLAELNGQSLGLGAGAAKGGKHKKPKKMKGDADDGAGGEDEMRDNLSPLDKKGHASRKLREYPTNSHALTMRDRDYDGPGGYRSWKEPYMYLWTVMSGMYGKLVVLLMFAFCLTEVLENDVAPLTFQGIFLIYLYVGSIFAIICIYTSVIMENCPSMSASKENLTKQGDPEVGSINSFGTLKRAHISRSKTSRTSFYLRIGALVFGLVTLIFNGLEIAMHSTMRDDCAQDVMFAHPIMQALFTFLQMHFLFVNSEVVVEKFGQIARFAFMHLVATNLAIWVRMVVWESANDWIRLNYGSSDLYDMPWHAQKVLHLHTCYHNNTLGRLWTGSQQQFFPFLIEYSLIAAAVTYIMWRNVGKEHIKSFSNLSKAILEETLHEKRGRKGHWKVDCRSASKGLFLGLLVLVGGIVILIIFFVMKDHDGFDEKMFWMVNGSQIIILSLSILSCLIGFWQIPKLAVSSTKPLELDRLLLSCTIVGVYIFAIFGMIVGGLYIDEQKLMTIFCSCCLLVIQVSLQGMLVAEASRRTCSTRLQQLVKPGRQVITFLLFSNITLWILDSFITHSTLSQQFQIGFYGTLAWGIISRISLPLMILFRFHSAVILVEIWKNTYRTKAE
ncbi:uncharacterized protein LOC108675669 isoform X1 [Hyalella azteca]|uniref:Uncharacterized protein LOC108675669 isoform X1 n=1 Tax=Hyalella azteca TaxID=294128 RepID=A0A979FY14_HYAAZ|nr:uncharacterized protein LOC108675669 isoform X1 [Hyalella azteca]